MFDPLAVTKYAALVVGVVMILNGVYLLGFARHRLRAYNVVICLSTALVAVRLYAQLETKNDGADWVLPAVWVNLAVWSVVGLIGMVRIAATDPHIWGGAKGPPK